MKYTPFFAGSTLMEIKWTSKTLSELAFLYEFLALTNKSAAARAIQALTQSPTILLTNSRLGEQLFQFEPREIRRFLVGEYEVHNEIQKSSSMCCAFGLPERLAKHDIRIS